METRVDEKDEAKPVAPPNLKELEKQPASATRVWLPAVLALLGSTGVVSVFGPLTGELYWEGYLAAFGLTPQEFPAAPAHISKFAYQAIVEGVASVFLGVWEFWPVLLIAVVAVAIAPLLLGLAPLKARLGSMSSRAKRSFASESLSGSTMRAMARLVVALLTLIIVAYVALMVIVLLISPNQARKLGLRNGDKDRHAYEQRGAASLQCETIDMPGVAFLCPTVIVYGDKTLAVLDRGKVIRILREGTKLTSVLPSASQAASSTLGQP